MENSDSLRIEDLLRNSILYREFQAEREEISRHKWLESEKAGYDIGFERALVDWIIKHKARWRRGREKMLDEIERCGITVEVFADKDAFNHSIPLPEDDYRHRIGLAGIKGEYVLEKPNTLRRASSSLPSAILSGVIANEYKERDSFYRVYLYEPTSLELSFRIEQQSSQRGSGFEHNLVA